MHGTDSKAAVLGTLATLFLHGALWAQDAAPAPLPLVPVAEPSAADAPKLIDALRVRERRLHVAPAAARLAEFPKAEILKMNAEAAALLKFAKNEKTEAVLKSVMVTCAKTLRDR